MSILVQGHNAKQFFLNETGNHRWVRVPPTERNGRTHTSFVNVSVLDKVENKKYVINRNEVEKTYTRGSGAGGQNRNKRETVVVLKHTPTGLTVRSDSQRTQYQNETIAFEMLTEKLSAIQYSTQARKTSDTRQEQIGSGERGIKRRTYRVKEDLVVDHLTNKNTTVKQFFKGKIELLH